MLALSCGPGPSLRTFDPYGASQSQVDNALAQLEDLSAFQLHGVRETRYIAGGTSMAIGLVLEVVLLARDPCVPTSVLGVEVEDCSLDAALIGVAGGLIGGGFGQLLIPLDGELDRRGLAAAEAATESQRRVKLEHTYRLLEGQEDTDFGAIHQLGSGLLLGLGVAFMTLPVAIEDEDLDDFLIPGAISAGVGVLWGVLAGTLREPPTFDLSVRPEQTTGEGWRVGLAARF
jgi:hypothetical protein